MNALILLLFYTYVALDDALFLIDNHESAFNSSDTSLLIRDSRQARPELRITLDEIASVFRLSQHARQIFKERVYHGDLVMIYPSKEDFVQSQRLVLSAQPREPELNKRLVYKFEVSSKVRLWWNIRAQNSLHAPRPGTPIERIMQEFEPMELHVQKLCAGKPFFIKFYKENSFILPRETDALYVYAIDKINKAQDLLKWYSLVKNSGIQEVERKLKPYLRTIFSALMYLLHNKLVYTDLKPENILIDREADKAYLIDLESATTSVSPPYTQLIYTLYYFPMDDGRIIDTNRILTWTFGQTIYRLLCVHDNGALSERIPAWMKMKPARSWMDHFGCPKSRGISTHLKNVINLLLTPRPNPNFAFHRDLMIEYWFNS